MVTITFPDRETERRALAFLLGRFSGQVLQSGEHLVPEPALEALADQNIEFTVKGKATNEQQPAANRRENGRHEAADPLTDRSGPSGQKRAADSAKSAENARTEGDAGNAASIALLRSWLEEDATDDPEEIREAQKELDEFKRSINAERESVGARQIYP